MVYNDKRGSSDKTFTKHKCVIRKGSNIFRCGYYGVNGEALPASQRGKLWLRGPHGYER